MRRTHVIVFGLRDRGQTVGFLSHEAFVVGLPVSGLRYKLDTFRI
jgi:hypothetical protein